MHSQGPVALEAEPHEILQLHHDETHAKLVLIGPLVGSRNRSRECFRFFINRQRIYTIGYPS